MKAKKIRIFSTLSLTALLFACATTDAPSNSSSLGSSNNSTPSTSINGSSSSTSKGDSSSSTSSPIDSSTSSGGNSSTSSQNQSSTGGQTTTSNNGQTSSTGGQTTTSGNNQTSTGGQTSSSDPTLEEPSIVEDKSFDELADASSIDNNHLYKVVGIWFPETSNNQGGKGSLKLATSSKTIDIYGLAKDSNNAFSFDNKTGAYSFTNPNNYSEAQLHEGDKLTLVIGVHNTSGYGAYLKERVAYTEVKYDISVTIDGNTGGSAILDVQNNKGYLGQEVTLTITPTMGYEVESVKFNESTLTAEQDTTNTYKFKVAFVTNNVVVKFVKSAPVEPEVTSKTIEDLKGSTYQNNTNLYKVEGIWLPSGTVDDNTIGYGELVDQTSGDAIKIKGMAKDKSAFTFGDDGTYTFTNTNDYKDRNLNAGDKVELIVGVYETDGFNAAYVERKQESKDITYNITKNVGNGGEISLDKESGTYGEEIEVTVTAHDGYLIKSVKHNTDVLTAEEGNKYTFKITVGTNAVNVEFDVTEPSHGTATITEIADNPIKDENKKLYEITGVWIHDLSLDSQKKYGDGKLLDPQSGKSIDIYGMANKDTGFTYNKETQSYSFKNPTNYGSIYGTSFNDGDEIKLLIGNYEDNNGYKAQFVERTRQASDIVEYTITKNIGENGSATFNPEKEKYYYGEEITITTQPSEGYRVDSVTVNDQTITATETNTYKFKVGLANNVSVTFVSESQPLESVVYTLDANTKGSGNSYDGTRDVTVDGIVWSVNGNAEMQPWRFGGKSLNNQDRTLTSKTPISHNISKVEIEFGDSSITVNKVTFSVYKQDPTTVTEGNDPIFTKDLTYIKNGSDTVVKEDATDWTNCYYRITFNVSNSTTKNQYVTITKMDFYAYA